MNERDDHMLRRTLIVLSDAVSRSPRPPYGRRRRQAPARAKPTRRPGWRSRRGTGSSSTSRCPDGKVPLKSYVVYPERRRRPRS